MIPVAMAEHQGADASEIHAVVRDQQIEVVQEHQRRGAEIEHQRHAVGASARLDQFREAVLRAQAALVGFRLPRPAARRPLVAQQQIDEVVDHARDADAVDFGQVHETHTPSQRRIKGDAGV